MERRRPRLGRVATARRSCHKLNGPPALATSQQQFATGRRFERLPQVTSCETRVPDSDSPAAISRIAQQERGAPDPLFRQAHSSTTRLEVARQATVTHEPACGPRFDRRGGVRRTTGAASRTELGRSARARDLVDELPHITTFSVPSLAVPTRVYGSTVMSSERANAPAQSSERRHRRSRPQPPSAAERRTGLVLSHVVRASVWLSHRTRHDDALMSGPF